MLISQLLTGRKRSNFTIIKDNTSFNGISILNEFIESATFRNVRVHLILSEYSTTDLCSNPNVIIYNYFSDPWKLCPGKNGEFADFEVLIQKILDSNMEESLPIMVVIDSVASILQSIDICELCRCLKKVYTTLIKEDISLAQIVTILHSELIPEDSEEFKYLSYMASTEINLKQESSSLSIVDIVHCQYNNGKKLKETYSCSLDSNKDLLFEIRKTPPKIQKEENEDLLMGTTFKLTLEENEKKSRSKVELPYLKSSNTIGKGRIFYEPDANDDWDDEDPDDDLEI